MSAPRPAICRNCRKLTGLSATCPWCGGRPLAPRTPRSSQGPDEVEAGGAIVTQILLVVMLAIYVGGLLAGGARSGGDALDLLAPSPELLERLGLVRSSLVLHGEWWRLIAAIFLHLSILHMLFNGMALWNLGRIVEADFGPAAFWSIFLASGVAGFALGLPLEGTPLAVPATAGASGSLCGLIGAILARRRILDGDFSAPVSRMAGQFALYTLVFGLAVPGVNNVAHGGGFVAGLLLGALHAATEGGQGAVGPGSTGSLGAARGWAVAALLGLGASGVVAYELLGSAERTTGEQVLVMDHCVREVVGTWGAITPGHQGPAPVFACLAATAPFKDEPEALDALRGLREACDRLEAARLSGDSRARERGLDRLLADARRWRSWVERHLDRFNLRFKE